MQPSDRKREQVGLPMRPFLYTIDQIAALLDMKEQTLKTHYIFFAGRSTGDKSPQHMMARNIAPPDQKPVWRVAEQDFMRWLRMKGFRIYEHSLLKY